MLAYVNRPGTSNGPTEAINSRLEHLRSSALGFRIADMLGRKQSRGRMVGLVFAMQGAGLVVGPLVASILLASGISDNLVWRILLGLGAVPGLAVYYMRRQIHETPRFALAGGATEEAQAAVADATGQGAGKVAAGESTAKTPHGVADGFLELIRNRRLLIWLIGAACPVLLIKLPGERASDTTPS